MFLTGDIHTFIVGDVRTNMGLGDSVAVEFVGGSITSAGLGESNIDVGGTVIKGNDGNPQTPASLIQALQGINPWVDSADTDHHGYGVVEAASTGLTCQMVRMQTIKKKTTATLPAAAMTYKLARGQVSVKGQHGPAA